MAKLGRPRLLQCAMALVMAFAVPVLAEPALAESAFSAAQRGEIVDVVRAALKADPSLLRDAVAAMQADDLKVQEAASRAAIGRVGPALARTPEDPVAGDPNGDVTLVEFSDLRCPYCRKMLPVVAQLLAEDPRLRLIYKDIPILGTASRLGARAVLAAQRQDGYRKLHDAVMQGPREITEDSLHAAADRAGLDWPRLLRDMDDPAIAKRIDANLDLAHALGIQGTPVYVVGTALLPGAVGIAELQAAIAAARRPPG